MSDTKIKGEAVREQAVAHGDQLREAAVARSRGLHEAAVARAGEVMDGLRGAPAVAASVPVTVVAEAPAIAPPTVVTPPDEAQPPAARTETSAAG